MKKSWSNTALVAYSLLPKIANEIDFAVQSRVKSSFQSRHLKIGVSNEQLIGEILALTDEKRKIVNMRYVVATALKQMKEKDRNILIDRIVKKTTFQDISTNENISLRTAFRRVSIAEEAFAKNLRDNGYDEQWFEQEYGNDKLIMPIRKQILTDKYFVAKNL
mgnify:FL=1